MPHYLKSLLTGFTCVVEEVSSIDWPCSGLRSWRTGFVKALDPEHHNILLCHQVWWHSLLNMTHADLNAECVPI